MSAPNPAGRSRDLRELLLARIRAEGGEWTVGRVKRLYAQIFPTHMLRSTIRRHLTALHEAGHLVRHETAGRRHYTAAEEVTDD